MTTVSIWERMFPDEDERHQWRTEFTGDFARAAVYATHFTDPAAALQWALIGSLQAWPDRAAHLHAHGVPADAMLLFETEKGLLAELTQRPAYDHDELMYRTTLKLAHPHLTRADRDALTAARIPVTELDDLLTRPLDHNALSLIGALR